MTPAGKPDRRTETLRQRTAEQALHRRDVATAGKGALLPRHGHDDGIGAGVVHLYHVLRIHHRRHEAEAEGLGVRMVQPRARTAQGNGSVHHHASGAQNASIFQPHRAFRRNVLHPRFQRFRLVAPRQEVQQRRVAHAVQAQAAGGEIQRAQGAQARVEHADAAQGAARRRAVIALQRAQGILMQQQETLEGRASAHPQDRVAGAAGRLSGETGQRTGADDDDIRFHRSVQANRTPAASSRVVMTLSAMVRAQSRSSGAR